MNQSKQNFKIITVSESEHFEISIKLIMSIVMMFMGITQKVFACNATLLRMLETHVVLAEDLSSKTLYFGVHDKVTEEDMNKLENDKRGFVGVGSSHPNDTSSSFLKHSGLNKYLSPEHISFVENSMLRELSGFIDIKIRRKPDGSYDEAIVVKDGKEVMRLNNRSPKTFRAYYESAPHSIRYESITDGNNFESREFSPSGKVEKTVKRNDGFDRVIDFKNKSFVCEPFIKGSLDKNSKVASVELTGLELPPFLASRVNTEFSTTNEVDCDIISKDMSEFLTIEMPLSCVEDIGESLQETLTQIESHYEREVQLTNATLSQKAGRLGEILTHSPDPIAQLGTMLFNRAATYNTVKDIDSLKKQRELLKEESVAQLYRMEERAKNRIRYCQAITAQNSSERTGFKQIESSSKFIKDTKKSLATWQ
jgi:hypothetical protein